MKKKLNRIKEEPFSMKTPIKPYEQIIKNKECNLDCEEENDNYYFCNCNLDTKFYICESCIKKCHSGHKEISQIKGRFRCECGLRNHKITEEEKIKEKKLNEIEHNLCFWESFNEKEIIRKFYKLQNKEIRCALCVDLCIDKTSEKILMEIQPENQIELKCECKKHRIFEMKNINVEMSNINDEIANNSILNFNFNIFLYSKKFKGLFLDNKDSKQIEIKNRKLTSEMKVEYFIEYRTSLFMHIFKNYGINKISEFLHFKNCFKDSLNQDDLIYIISEERTKSIDLKAKIMMNFDAYYETKIIFIFVLFEFFIKSHYKNNNNILNHFAISNFNIFQRKIHLYDSKYFYKFTQKLLQNNPNNDRSDNEAFNENFARVEYYKIFIKSLTESINIILESLIQFELSRENTKKYNNTIQTIIQLSIKMYKFLIKYNLIEKETKITYFKTLEDILIKYVENYTFLESQIPGLFQKNYKKQAKNISGKNRDQIEKILKEPDKQKIIQYEEEIQTFSKDLIFLPALIKTVYHFITQENDEVFLENIKNEYKGKDLNNNYVFCGISYKYVSKIFIYSLQLFMDCCYANDKENFFGTHVLVTDFYIKRIFDSILGENNSYIDSFKYFLNKYEKAFFHMLMKDPKSKDDPVYKNYKYIESRNHEKYGKFYLEYFTKINFNVYNKLKEFSYQEDIRFLLNQNIEFKTANKKFYAFEYDFFQYVKNINRIFESLKNYFFNQYSKFLGIEDLKVLDEDIDYNKLKKVLIEIKTMQEFKTLKFYLGFTNFFNNINEFIDIYSKIDQFNLQIKEKKLSNEIMKIILLLITKFSENNIECFALFSSIKIIKFIKVFINQKEDLIEYFSCLCKVYLENDVFENSKILTKFMTNLIKLMPINNDKIELIHCLNARTKVMKFYSGILSKASLSNSESLMFLETLLNDINKLKNNKVIRKYFQNCLLESDLNFENRFNSPPTNSNKVILLEDIFIDNFKNKQEYRPPAAYLDAKMDFQIELKNDKNIILEKEDENNFRNEDNHGNELPPIDIFDDIEENNTENNTCENENNSEKKNNKSEKILNSNPANAKNNDKKESSSKLAFQNYIKQYLKLFNIILEQKLDYFNFFDSQKHILFSFSSLISVVKSKILNQKLKREIEKFLHNYCSACTINFNNIEEKYNEYTIFNQENLNNKIFFKDYPIERNQFSYSLLNFQMKNFMMYLTNLDFSKKFIKENDCIYFQECILAPMYKMMNLYLIHKTELNSEDNSKIKELLIVFIELSKKFYTVTEIFDIENTTIRENIVEKKKKQLSIKLILDNSDKEYLDMSSEMIYKLKIDEFLKLIDIFRMVVLIIKNNDSLYINYLREKICQKNQFEDAMFDCYHISTKDFIFSEKYQEIKSNFCEKNMTTFESIIDTLVSHYKNTYLNSEKDDWSFIKTVNSFTELRSFYDCAPHYTIVKYCLTKFFDNFTDLEKAKKSKNKIRNYTLFENPNLLNLYNYENKRLAKKGESIKDIKQETEEDKFWGNWFDKLCHINPDLYDPDQFNHYFNFYEKNYINPKNYKFSNFYALKIFRNIMDLDSDKTQLSLRLILEETFIDLNSNEIDRDDILIKNRLENLVNFLCKFFIFGFVNLEKIKICEFSSNKYFLKHDIIYESLINSIFLFQNMLEGTEKNLQDYLYPLKIENITIQNNNHSNEEKIDYGSLALLKLTDLLENKSQIDINKTIIKNVVGYNKNNEINLKIKNDHYNTEQIINRKDPFLYFMIRQMKNLISYIYYDNYKSIEISYLRLRNDINLININRRFCEFFVDMIQGCKMECGKYFFNLFDIDIEIENLITNSFEKNSEIMRKNPFTALLRLINSLEYEKNLIEYEDLLTIKIDILDVMINLEKNKNFNSRKNFIIVLDYFFEGRKLAAKISDCMSKVLTRYYFNVNYEHPFFNYYKNKINLNHVSNQTFFQLFNEQEYLTDDNYYFAASQMFYYLLLLYKEFKVDHAEKLLTTAEITYEKKKNFVTNIISEIDILKIKDKIEILDFTKKGQTLIKDNLLDNSLYDNIKEIYFLAFELEKEDIIMDGNFLEKKDLNTQNNLDKEKQILTKNDEKDNLIKDNNNTKFLKKKSSLKVLPLSKTRKSIVKSTMTKLLKQDNEKNKYLKNHQDFLEKIKCKTINRSNDESILEYSLKFFMQICRNVEVIDGSGNNNKYYFFFSPLCNLINKNTQKEFFENYNRKDATSKLKSLYESIDHFEVEIDYKKKIFKTSDFKNRFLKYWLDFNYGEADLLSVLFTTGIKLYLLIKLDQNSFNDSEIINEIYWNVFIIGIIQIAFNFLFLVFYMIARYKFYLLILFRNKNKEYGISSNQRGNEKFLKKLNLLEKIKLYLFETFLFNKEIFLMNYNIVIGIIAIIHFNHFFVFSLQFFTLVRFIDTTKDLFKALRTRYDQVLTMIFFLFMLTYFYSTIGMFFFNTEFAEMGTGHVKNFLNLNLHFL